MSRLLTDVADLAGYAEPGTAKMEIFKSKEYLTQTLKFSSRMTTVHTSFTCSTVKRNNALSGLSLATERGLL